MEFPRRIPPSEREVGRKKRIDKQEQAIVKKKISPALESYDPERAQAYWNRFEKTAHEVVRHGIFQLSQTLENIYTTHGSLPSTIMYPESTSRPLRYALTPLLREVYAEHGERMPVEAFVKTYSHLHSDESRATEIGHLNNLIEPLFKEYKIVNGQRNARIALLKQLQGESWEQASVEAHELKRRMSAILEKINLLKEKRDRIMEIDAGPITTDRVREIFSHTSEGPTLVVDDVLGSGRTFDMLENTFQALHKRDVYYFAFITHDPKEFQERPWSQRLSLGVARESYDPVVNPQANERIGYIHGPEVQGFENDLEYKLMFWGFPFRLGYISHEDSKQKIQKNNLLKKRQIIGVEKDQSSTHPYTELTEDRDRQAMRKVRQQYRAWGEDGLRFVHEKKKLVFQTLLELLRKRQEQISETQ